MELIARIPCDHPACRIDSHDTAAIHDKGDGKTVVIVGQRFQFSGLTREEYQGLRIGAREWAVEIPRALILEAAAKMQP